MESPVRVCVPVGVDVWVWSYDCVLACLLYLSHDQVPIWLNFRNHAKLTPLSLSYGVHEVDSRDALFVLQSSSSISTALFTWELCVLWKSGVVTLWPHSCSGHFRAMCPLSSTACVYSACIYVRSSLFVFVNLLTFVLLWLLWLLLCSCCCSCYCCCCCFWLFLLLLLLFSVFRRLHVSWGRVFGVGGMFPFSQLVA